MNTLRRIAGWLAPYRTSMVLALLLTTLAALCNLPVPLLVQELIDRVVTRGQWGTLPLYAAGLLLVYAAQASLALVQWSADRPDRPGGGPRPPAPAVRPPPAALAGVLR